MTKVKIFLFLFIASFLVIHSVSADEIKNPDKTLSYKEFVSNLNPKKNTSLYIEYFWKKYKGKSFTWTAKVVYVKGSRGRAEIRAASEGSALYKGFNLILVTQQQDAAAELKIGQEFKFKGNVYNYRNNGGAFIVYLNNVQLLSSNKK